MTDILKRFVGQKVIVRDHGAGIFVTTLVDIKGKSWIGGESRKIHGFANAGAIQGIPTQIDLDKSRITAKTGFSCGRNFIEMIPVSKKAFKKLMNAPIWRDDND